MGEENVLPAVEESTEPPICGHSSTYHGPPTTAGQHPYSQPHPRHDGAVPTPLTAAHTLTATQVALELGVDISNGLNTTEAESRLRHYGPNKVKGAEGLSMWKILLRQVSNSLTLVCAFSGCRIELLFAIFAIDPIYRTDHGLSRD